MTKFTDLNLNAKVLKAVVEAGYESPTPIQAGAIPPALEGRDVLGIAQTGTGKTASFTLPMISILAQGRAKARMPRSLILCPTRELAEQVATVLRELGAAVVVPPGLEADDVLASVAAQARKTLALQGARQGQILCP